MSTADVRVVLDEHWRRLEAAPVSAGQAVRTSALPVETARGPLLAAVDDKGMRHLLVPLHTRQRISTGSVSASLRVSERPLEDEDTYGRFADIACTRRELDDVFTGLCRDVLVALEADGERPYRTARAVVERWRQLFSASPWSLTSEQIVGLFGELVVLNRLLEDDPGAVHLWAGPDGERHDFTDGRHAVEVKSSATISERRVFQVHGLDQLEAPAGGSLLLAWHRFEQRPEGCTLGELVGRAHELCDDEVALSSKLARIGYRSADDDHRDGPRLSLAEERWYLVDDGIPRLIAADVVSGETPVGVLDVRYTVDLASVRTAPLDETTLTDLLARMGETA